MASKRRFKGCSGEEVRNRKEAHIEGQDKVLPGAQVNLCEVVFSQYELLRRICQFLPSRDLFNASLGEKKKHCQHLIIFTV